MQHRSFALICSIVGILYSGLVSALGMGEITLKSQYNQPLNAEIRLLKVRDLSEEEILVSLGSPDDFNRAGVDRVFFLTGLNFEVVLNNPSYPFIRVTSRKPITEPYLNFLVETQWPSGRLLREYTLLLDLPVFSEAPTNNSVVNSPSRSTAPIQRSSNQYSSSPSRSAPVSRSTPSNYAPSNVDSYKVRSGDTLWEIAESVRPSSSVTVHQTMIALQQANPEAFIGGNINRLKNGRVLRVPDANEISDINYNQALRAVRSQNQAWSSEASTKAVLTSSAPASTPATSGSSPQGRLTLGAADTAKGDVRGAGASGTGQAVQKELSEAKEELSRTSRENSELKSRVNDLQSQIDTMEKLIQVTNDQLKALQVATQANADSAPADVNELVGETVEPETTDSEVSSIEDDTSLVEEQTIGAAVDDIAAIVETDIDKQLSLEEPQASEEEGTEVIAVEETAEVAPAPVVVAPIETSSGFDLIGFIKENLLAVGGILLALLAGILLLFRLREKPEESESDFDGFAMEDDDDLLDLSDQGDDELTEDTDYGLEEDDEIEAQTEDVVAEADIYVSLGQEDKAIELLEKEIQQNPDNADARLGLLKVFAKTQNPSAFDEQYAQLLPLGNVIANDQAMTLRKSIEDAGPFDTDQYSISPDSQDAFDSLNLDDELETDLNLDLDDDSGALDSLAESDASGDSIDTELDLDMGDVSLDLDEGSNLDELDLELGEDSLSFSESDELDLDLDLELELDDSELNPVDEMASELDKLDDDKSLDDLEFSIDSDFEKTLDDLDDGLTIENADANVEDMEFDLDFEEIESELDLVKGDVEVTEDALDDVLDLDAPPTDKLDLASLDEEISALTADMDSLDLSEAVSDEPALDLDIESDLDLDSALSVDLEESDINDDLSALDTDVDLPDLEESKLSDDSSSDDPFAGAELNIDSLVDEADSSIAGASDLEESLSLSSDDDVDLLQNTDEDLDILAASEVAGLDIDEDKTQLLEEVESDTDSSSSFLDSSENTDDELDFLEASDEVSTKLDLARAYIDMGDVEGAEDILNEVVEEGNTEQQDEAKLILKTL